MSDEDWDGSPAWLFLLGLVVFLATGLLFVADLIRGISILRSVAGNAVGVALLILWAAHDTLRNPDSVVGTPAGAAGTALLLYGLYLLAAGAALVVTSLLHDRFMLGVYYVAMAVAAVVVGFVVFPREGLVTEEQQDEEPTTADDGGDGEG